MHEYRYYDNMAPNTKCQRVLVLAHMPVFSVGGSLRNRLSGLSVSFSAIVKSFSILQYRDNNTHFAAPLGLIGEISYNAEVMWEFIVMRVT